MTAAQLLWGVLFSSVGVGYFIYGKKQSSLIPLVCGIALMGYVYFISNVYLLVSVGVVIAAIPYFLRD